MSEGNRAACGRLRFKRARVYYTYSVSLSQEGHPYMAGSEALKRAAARVKEMSSADDFVRIETGEGTPWYRRGITPHLKFKSDDHDLAWINYRCASDDKKSTPEIIDESRDGVTKRQPIELDATARLFPTAATWTLVLTLPTEDENQYGVDDALGLLKMVRLSEPSEAVESNTTDPPKIEIPYWPEPLTVYEMFRKAVRDLCKGQGSLRILGAPAEDHPSPYGSSNGPVLDLIDFENETQSPWTVTVLEVDQELADIFCGSDNVGSDPAEIKMLRMRPYLEEVATILYRYVGQGDVMQIEPAFLKSSASRGIPGLSNMGLEARLFVHVSRRSVLCIFPNIDDGGAVRFLRDLLNLSEIVRGRWHMLIMMNQVLDFTLKNMRAQDTAINDEDQIMDFMHLREWLSTTYEDPGIYVIAGEFLSELYRNLERSFRIVELRTLVSDKLQLLEKLFRDIQEHRYLTGKITLDRGAR